MSPLRVTTTALTLTALGSVLLLATVLVNGPVTADLGAVDAGPFGTATVGLGLDAVRAMLLVLVTGVGAVVAAYSRRNLAGQARLARFAVLQLVVVLGLALAVSAASLPLLALGWIASGLAMSGLVEHAGGDRARAASRWVRRRLLVGDLALVAAVVVSGAWLGVLDVAALGAAAGTGAAAEVVAVLVVLAGAVRSALVPAHRWLPEVAEAPSPVSALLHAGFVNGIGILALLLWPLLSVSGAARGLAFALGLATVVIATAQLRVRSDVKGRLASSTSAQMGYLAVTLGLGLPAAALIHLLGHGMWKAGLFLGAGGAIERARAARAPHASRRDPRAWLAAALGVLVVLLAAGLPLAWAEPLLSMPAYLLPVAVAALAAAVAARAAATGRRAGSVVVALAAATGYVLAVRLADHALADVLGWSPPAWGEPGTALLAGAVAGLLLVGAVGWLLDARLRRGAMPGLAARVGRSVHAPVAALPRIALPAPVPGSGLPAPEPALVVEATVTAAEVVAPSWPLAAFVASNPLAGLEHLDFADAVDAAAATWGARTEIDAALLRASLDDGVLDPAALQRVAATVAPGLDLPLQGCVRERSALVAAALLAEEPPQDDVDWVRSALGARSWGRSRRRLVSSPAEAAADGRPELVALDSRGRDLVATYAARSYGAASWPSPYPGVWDAVRGDAAHLDRLLRTRGAAGWVASMPVAPAEAVAEALARCGVLADDVVPALSRVLARDPGWVAHLAWRRRVGRADGVVELLDLLAARLVLESLVVAAAGPRAALVRDVEDDLAPVVAMLIRASGAPRDSVAPAALDALREIAVEMLEEGLGLLRLRALEESYRRPLIQHLAARAEVLAGAPVAGQADAQVVACIDVRSERLRRALEARGPWETLGAAGFFGLPLAHCSASGALTERLPALLRPAHVVSEPQRATPWAESVLGETSDAVHAVELAPAAPFALAEAAGWVSGPSALLHTVLPRLWGQVRPGGESVPEGVLDLEQGSGAPAGFGLDELVAAAAAFLRTTGLLHPAPVVLLLGHGGHAANNPHVAAYDCGACGGFAGDVSARAMAQVLNDPRVRDGLRAQGIDLPAATWFGAALHDTTRDRVSMLVDVPPACADVVARLLDDVAGACDAVAAERAPLLPERLPADTARLRGALDSRAVDWAQVRPEWGLARNAAIVIGPRSLTDALDLDGRVFLQSYRAELDEDGSSLDFLMSAPLVVAQWISSQYWCSTVDPLRFGAGDKTTHNVLTSASGEPAPLTAVVTGARGDLRIGLPWQAVSASAPSGGRWTERPFHEPLRLLAVIHASTSAVEAVLARRPEVARLVLGGWVSLVVLDPATGAAWRRDPEAGWVPAEHVVGGHAVLDRAGDEVPGSNVG
ncbi:putative inorganic carbon transporter subunit DabA [Longivirga aurantiaca]|uniref:Probable inorganic carbon transporter subunit DabA n=1 Tax=Longivirga aurantiaca TaxID=1837743 RepID=A0ABW1T6C2_9ACTN